MPKKLPSYRLHAASGQGYTSHKGKAYYFGVYNTPKSLAKFARFIAQITAEQRPDIVLKPGSDPLVSELCLAFWKHVQTRYVKQGKPTTEVPAFRTSLAPVVDLYGDLPASEFGPIALQTVRQQMIAKGLARKTINQSIGRIVRCWKWGVAQQIVPAMTWQALTSLEPLRIGQAADRPPVKPVAEDRVNAIQPHVSRQVWAMIQFQLWTACRPQEACQVRFADIDRTHDIWEFRPGRFKTQHRGANRVILLGKHAQALVLEWERSNPEEYLWQPRDARREWLAAHGSHKTGRGKHQAGVLYTTGSYGRAIENGCERAFGMPDELRVRRTHTKEERAAIHKRAAAWRKANGWTPNQLRHAAATRIRKTYGIEVARIILGHASAFTTEIYAEDDLQKARQAVRDLG